MEYKPNPELERLRAKKEKNEKEIEQLDHKTPDWKIDRSITRTVSANAAPIVFVPSQELWKLLHRRSRSWTSPR